MRFLLFAGASMDEVAAVTGQNLQTFDLVGVGALNVDFIAGASAQAADPDLARGFGAQFEVGTERPMDRSDALRLVSEHGGSFSKSLGGSAFNVINAASEANPSLRIGCLGVIGTPAAEAADFDLWFHNHPRIRAVVGRYDDIQGICVSWIRHGERTLRTYPGVNTRFPDFLRGCRSEILEVLCRTKLVHITSLFDAESPSELLSVLKEVKSVNPLVQFSFDPGHHWVHHMNPSLEELFGLSDYVFLNLREFMELGDFKYEEHRDAAGRILDRYCPGARIVVLKKYNSISAFFKHGRGVQEFSYVNETLTAEQIEDATGAGDVFAGGFLASRLDPMFDMKDSIDLALEMVKAKLQASGSSSYTSFRRLYEAQLDLICGRNRALANDVQNDAFISRDFTELRVGAHDYCFTGKQAQIIEYMLRRILSGQRNVSVATLAADLEKPDKFRMNSAFQSSEAWNQLVRPGDTKGSYSLALTPAELDQLRPLVADVDQP